MLSVSVAIPIYKEIPDEDEILSFNQCLKLLNYPVILFCAESLKVDSYQTLADQKGRKILFERFPDHYFNNTSSYSQLLLSGLFYKRFCDYKYILLYQLDALIFKDELKYWCESNCDFVGAPLFEKWTDPNKTLRFMDGQNGGFSLRNIESSLCVLKRINLIRKVRKIIGRNFLFTLFVRMLSPVYSISNISLLNTMIDFDRNEDYFWSMLAPKTFSGFKVLPHETALRFSFEVNPSYLYKLNGNKLPFGCHAWKVYEPGFWKPFVENISS